MQTGTSTSVQALFAILLAVAVCPAATPEITFQTIDKPRVVVLTDITNEPDDEQSMVRFLVYANEFDVEGLIATTSVWLRDKTRPEQIRARIAAYGQVRHNLLKHAPGFPAADELMRLVKTGRPEFGMAGVGDGKTSEGSDHIISLIDKPDDRPVWISVWGGANCLAQALHDVRRSRTEQQLKQFVSRLRVYTISDQDDSGRWMRLNFPGLFFIVSPSSVDHHEYHKATWTGISGDRFYKNAPMHAFHLVDNPWLEENIINNHGPLGRLYPRLAYIMEGDTPSFIGLINNGLAWQIRPSYGGWGGRYALHQSYAETQPIWTNTRNSRDTVTADNGHTSTSDQATIWRWRQAYQHDFAARMDWCIADTFQKANHNPIITLNGNKGKAVANITAKPGDRIQLNAAGTIDPDGDALTYKWFQYQEAGTSNAVLDIKNDNKPAITFTVPKTKDGTIHVILEVKDDGTPELYSYRRIVITVKS